MAADEGTGGATGTGTGGAGAPPGGPTGTATARGFFPSWSLITGTAAAVVVEVLLLFGLRPLRVWIPVLVLLAGGGALLALFDRNDDTGPDRVYWMTFAALAVSIASLLLAAVTYVGGFTFLG